MPFRLLGLVADPDRVGDICGKAFVRYAASGAEVTLVCATGHDANPAQLLPVARALGVRDLVLLDYHPNELSASGLEAVFTDILTGVQPHVVVADPATPAITEAVAGAFARARQVAGGSAALPAKLYFRLTAGAPNVGVTTGIAVGDGTPELFIRAFPEPWLTGVLERDLFAGIPVGRAPEAERLAS